MADGAAALRQRIGAYLERLRDARRLSVHTLDATRRDLLAFAEWLGERPLDVHAVRGFLADQNRRGKSPASLHRYLSTLRGFLRHEVRAGHLEGNPADGVRAPKRDRPLPKTLSVDQVDSLMHAQGGDPLAVRDLAMLELLYSSGLRLSELVGLDLHSFDSGFTQVRVLGKGRKERVVPVGTPARQALTHWLRERAAIAAPDEQAVFVGVRGRRLTQRTIQARLARWAERAGLDVRLHPHRLRHSFASHLLQSSGDLRAVQELLGHANIATTQIYTHLDFSFLSGVYDAAHPRARRRES